MQRNIQRHVIKLLASGLIGCAAGLFATHPAQAAPTAKTARRVTIHTAIHHPIDHHPVYHHVVYHRPIEHRAVYHHPVYHHVAYHRPIEHHVVIRRPVEHAPLIHYAVRKTYHHVFYHPIYRRADYLWCVPYARDVSHIDLTGDAFLWWAEAAGRYERGQRPADGAVLNFRSSARIRLGHVAVVAKVINSREILVNQANWVPDQVSHDVPVIDVSPDNNWTMVRVSIGGGRFGAPYPTFGFIYDQPLGGGAIYASRGTETEVAAAPPVRRLRLTAPNRSVR
jgi:surface antigen